MKLSYALSLLALHTACQSARLAEPVMAPDSMDNAWEYLADKYDRDGDGQVIEAEYTRTDGNFEKLDRNADGVVDAEDYPHANEPRSAASWNDIPAARKKSMGAGYSARAVMLTYWQSDPTAERLHEDVLLAMFEKLDSDSSGALDESEFACATDACPLGRSRPSLAADVGGGRSRGRLIRRSRWPLGSRGAR